MAEDDQNQVPGDAEEATSPAPAKKKAVRKKVPAKKAAVKKKVVTKKKAAPKKKAARKRSIAPKQKIAASETIVATDATTINSSESATDVSKGESVVAVAMTSASNLDTQPQAETTPSTEKTHSDTGQPAITATSETVQPEVESVSATSSDGTIDPVVPKRNENVQKRLEEMGLMPSDSPDNQTPPPASAASTGLGFWQKSFIWTIVIVAGLLYFRNVTNNGEVDSTEIATTAPQAVSPNVASDEKSVGMTPAASNNALPSGSVGKAKQPEPDTSAVAATSNDLTPEQPLVPDQANKSDLAASGDGAPVDEQLQAVDKTASDPVASSFAETSKKSPTIDKGDALVSESVSDEEPAGLVEKFTSMLKGSDTTEVVADKVMEQGAATATQAIIAHDTASVSIDSAKGETGAMLNEVVKAATAVTGSTDSPEVKGGSETSNNGRTGTDDSSQSDVNTRVSVISSEDTTADASAIASESKSSPAVAEEKGTDNSPKAPLSAMPGVMSRMMPSFTQNRGATVNPSRSYTLNNRPTTRPVPMPRVNRYGYPLAQPNVNRKPSQVQTTPRQRPTPIAQGYQGYGPQRYPQQYNQWPMRPYYGPYSVRPPVYGPAVRYPYPQPVPPVAK